MTSNPVSTPGKPDAQGFWLNDKTHRNWLMDQAMRQFDFFQGSIRPEGGFYTLAHDGSPLNSPVQELHTTTRLIHSYALGHLLGVDGADRIVETGMAYLQSHHKDPHHGGFVWAMSGDQIADDRKLAYGHFFVLLAAASAKLAGHPNADRLLQDVRGVLDAHFWDEDAALFCDELNRDWTPFSTYRGMNANMHGVEAMLAAFEATGEAVYLDRSGRILDFFINQVAAQEHWRLPEHYTENWDIDRNYAGDP
ncbi:MAG: AGE family epimerase/isomerase, partial [Planktomarina sp.]